MKIKINGKLIFNILVVVLSVGLITYFCISEDGLMDLISSSFAINYVWLGIAILMQLSNMMLDSLATLLFVRQRYNHINFFDAVKISFVGSFFSAITPSSTGGQPMQVYLMSKMHMDVGFSTSCMLQKFLIFQITSTAISVFAIIFRFQFFIENITTYVMWLFVGFGFLSQVTVTAMFLVVSFNKKLSTKIVKIVGKLLHKIKFIKNPDKKIAYLEEQVEMFHKCNSELMKKPKLLVSSYIIIAVQILTILLVPYCIYRSFNLDGAFVIDMVCSQAFVTLASAMMPLPGATGAAELGFNVFYGAVFTSGLMKSAILLWRVITYYGVIALCAPFSYLTKDKYADEHKQDKDTEIKNDDSDSLNEISDMPKPNDDLTEDGQEQDLCCGEHTQTDNDIS